MGNHAAVQGLFAIKHLWKDSPISRIMRKYNAFPGFRPDPIAGRIRDSETAVVVARAAKHVVGFAVMEFHFDARRAHLVLLAVEPAYRRRGVGVALFRWLEKIACLGGITRIQLELRADNEGARTFYERLGFRATELRRGYYDGRLDALGMARRIGRGSDAGPA